MWESEQRKGKSSSKKKSSQFLLWSCLGCGRNNSELNTVEKDIEEKRIEYEEKDTEKQVEQQLKRGNKALETVGNATTNTTNNRNAGGDETPLNLMANTLSDTNVLYFWGLSKECPCDFSMPSFYGF